MDYKCIIVDDEPKARELLALLISKLDRSLEVCEMCSDVEEAEEAIIHHKPDIVFLDIQMPLFNGLEIYNRFKEITAKIVFVTAYDEYAVEAFEKNATDYLLKPIDPVRLRKAVDKCLYKLDNERLLEEAKELVEETGVKYPIFHQGEYTYHPLNDFLYVNANRSYSEMVTKEGQKFTVSKSLNKIEEEIASAPIFVRVHRSWMVNKNHIKGLNLKTNFLVLNGGEQIPIGQSYKKQLKELIHS